MFKLILFLLIIKSYQCLRSFSVVLDTTVSMREELSVIKANIGQIVNDVPSDFGNFVLVPFKDTVVEAPFTTQSAQEFLSRLNSITTGGGNDCPENSLAGIEAALSASEKQSTIFVFTDAQSNDHSNFRAVESLCKESHSQVMIFLSGYCVPSELGDNVGNVDAYYDVTKACSGALLQFNTIYDLRQAFRYMKEITNTDWTNVTPYTISSNKQLSFSVDSFTTDLMLVVSGNYQVIEVLKSNSQNARLESVVDTRLSMVMRLRQPDVGEYTANIRGQGLIFVTLYERNKVPFEFGFSTKCPRNIRETSARPIAGWTNYILINVKDSIKLHSVEWLNLGDSVKQVLILKKIRSGAYVSSVFVENGKMFRFWIIGEETSTQHAIKGPSKILSPQVSVNEKNLSWSSPQAEILDSELGLVDFGTGLTLACKVFAHPKPEISWEDEHNVLYPSETVLLEMPSVYISYVTITNVTKNFTISCNCRNSVDGVSNSIDIFVNRTFSFDVIQFPSDTSVDYGSQHYLYCQVNAYPEATIKWYLNDSLIDTFNSRLSFQDNALVINNMGFEDIGAYKCRASNEVESKTFPANVDISGVEAPEIEESETDINLKPGGWHEIKCRISKGKPEPEISWKYRTFDASDFKNLPGDVSADSEKLKITSVEKKHRGVYRCIASNAMGVDTRDFNVNIQLPPEIRNSKRETIIVREGEQVHLPCEVEATPETTVRWEMSQDDLMVTLDQRHRTDERHTHHFMALYNDAGNYHCVAENNVGKAERTVILNVLVSPYIESAKSELIHVNNGDSVVLACNVLYGNPAPSTRWEFNNKRVYPTTSIDTDTTSALHLKEVTHSDEGIYLCIAENQIGTDRIRYHLVVQ